MTIFLTEDPNKFYNQIYLLSLYIQSLVLLYPKRTRLFYIFNLKRNPIMTVQIITPLLQKLGFPVLLDVVQRALGQVPHPAATKASETMQDVVKNIQNGGISPAQIEAAQKYALAELAQAVCAPPLGIFWQSVGGRKCWRWHILSYGVRIKPAL
jgi:hypothetical protein